MTRDEQILKAVRFYIGDNGTSDPAIAFHFKSGAEWADKHPNLESLWHNANDAPQGDNWKILCVDVYNGCWVESRVDAFLLHNKWDEYVGIESVKMWAYIDDLLPKSAWVL